ncbi:MAG: hypothetical protein Q9N67_09435 [Ghiorsea sp.]|nr:hypothetical protein [Ghiorsea sp.]
MVELGMLKLQTLLFLLCCVAYSVPVQAVELQVGAEKVWWQYQEYTNDAFRTANQASFLPSQSQGQGVSLTFSVSSELKKEVYFILSGAWMASTSYATEFWDIKQTNAIDIQQLDIRLDAEYAVLNHARVGFWLAGRKQAQSRQDFVVYGIATPVAGEPIVETIRSTWLGLSLIGTGGEQPWKVSAEVAVPLQVEVNNPLFTNSFYKKSGYRTALKFRWALPKYKVGIEGLNIMLDYQYQALGGEKQSDGSFWPYNRWQTLGFGLLFAS